MNHQMEIARRQMYTAEHLTESWEHVDAHNHLLQRGFVNTKHMGANVYHNPNTMQRYLRTRQGDWHDATRNKPIGGDEAMRQHLGLSGGSPNWPRHSGLGPND
jgi:hypothetical protein